MDERKKKIIKVSLICLAIALAIVAIVESFVLISLNRKIEDTQSGYEQIQNQLDELEKN